MIVEYGRATGLNYTGYGRHGKARANRDVIVLASILDVAVRDRGIFLTTRNSSDD